MVKSIVSCGVGSDRTAPGGPGGDIAGDRAPIPSSTAQTPTDGGRKSLVPLDVDAMICSGDASTETPNRARPVFPGAAASATPPIRSAARLLRRGDAVGRGGPPLRRHPRGLPGALPRL